jgi:hypothetical protein
MTAAFRSQASVRVPGGRAIALDETGAWTAAKRALLLRLAQAGVSRSAVRVPAGRPKWASRVVFVARHRYVIADKYRPGRETATRSTVAQAANIWLYVAELRRSQNCKDVLARELAQARRILALANQKSGLQVKDSKTVVRLIGVPRVRISPPPLLSRNPRVCSGLWPYSRFSRARADSRWRLLETAWVGLGPARNLRA